MRLIAVMLVGFFSACGGDRPIAATGDQTVATSDARSDSGVPRFDTISGLDAASAETHVDAALQASDGILADALRDAGGLDSAAPPPQTATDVALIAADTGETEQPDSGATDTIGDIAPSPDVAVTGDADAVVPGSDLSSLNKDSADLRDNGPPDLVLLDAGSSETDTPPQDTQRADDSDTATVADLSPPDSSESPVGFALISAGSFTMGAAQGGQPDEVLHTVTLTRDFWLQTTETTQAQWQALTGGNPANKSGCGGSCPVEQVSWWSALAYLNAMSLSESRAPCYTLPPNCSGSAANGNLSCSGSPQVNAPDGNVYACEGYRLPTEAEWEYAYRAGSSSELYNGTLSVADCAWDPTLDAIAWYCGNSAETTHPVGQKMPNAWGLYDMAGNVWELVWDGFDVSDGSAVVDPILVNTSLKLVRGGGWSYAAERCRASVRVAWETTGTSWAIGLRPARTRF